MFNKPRFFAQGGLSGLPLVHETASQQIQGGLPGEHYHLSRDAYVALIEYLAERCYKEPVMSITGEMVIGNDADVVLVLNCEEAYLLNDVAGPEVDIPAGDGTSDIYWSNVTAMAYMNIATGLKINDHPLVCGIATFPTLDTFFSRIFDAGNNSTGYSLLPIFGNNTLKASNPATAFLRVQPGNGACPSSSNTVAGDFTYEQHVAMEVGTNPVVLLCGNSIKGIMAESPSDGTIKFGATASGVFIDGQHTTVVWDYAFNQYYHLTLEREDNTVRLYIDGILKGSVTVAGDYSFTNLTCYAGFYGPLRFTHGIARYGGVNFTPPAGYYPAQ